MTCKSTDMHKQPFQRKSVLTEILLHLMRSLYTVILPDGSDIEALMSQIIKRIITDTMLEKGRKIKERKGKRRGAGEAKA